MRFLHRIFYFILHQVIVQPPGHGEHTSAVVVKFFGPLILPLRNEGGDDLLKGIGCGGVVIFPQAQQVIDGKILKTVGILDPLGGILTESKDGRMVGNLRPVDQTRDGIQPHKTHGHAVQNIFNSIGIGAAVQQMQVHAR